MLPLWASLLQAVDGVMFLALCLPVVFQAPQHFRGGGILKCWVVGDREKMGRDCKSVDC